MKCSCEMIHPEYDGRVFRDRTPGISKLPLYSLWVGVKYRCRLKTNYSQKSLYSERGIKISKDWSFSFLQFSEDMGNRPSLDHSIDRIDNDLGYCKHNCRWATKSEQSKNRRNTVSRGLPPGVTREKGGGDRFVARQFYRGKDHWIGTFKTPIDAFIAVNNFRKSKGIEEYEQFSQYFTEPEWKKYL